MLQSDDGTRQAALGSQSLADNGAFTFIGGTPCTDLLGEGVQRDDKRFVLAGEEARLSGDWRLDRASSTLEPTCLGIFVAGDCSARTTKRVVAAVGDGALTITCVHDLLSSHA